ncbi:MAG: DNA alkylation repair protein [Candidatus Omnitrophota bacterium]
MSQLKLIKKELKELSSPAKAKILQRFFKTGPGEYGEGDIFIGVTVPETRSVAKQFKDLSLGDTISLLHSPIHEERLCALFILIERYKKSSAQEKNKVYKIYLKNQKYINNWDLIDLSAEKIMGDFLFNKDKQILYRLARSKNLWARRIAIMATFYFIRNRFFGDTLRIAKALLHDEEDLIQKAVGWMLREVGKRNLKTEEGFLRTHYKKMPRTMLRYAIERFPETKRQRYLKGIITLRASNGRKAIQKHK